MIWTHSLDFSLISLNSVFDISQIIRLMKLTVFGLFISQPNRVCFHFPTSFTSSLFLFFSPFHFMTYFSPFSNLFPFMRPIPFRLIASIHYQVCFWMDENSTIQVLILSDESITDNVSPSLYIVSISLLAFNMIWILNWTEKKKKLLVKIHRTYESSERPIKNGHVLLVSQQRGLCLI